MIRNYLTIAWRNLKKNKVFSLINLLGLTIGITVCMMIFLFIVNQLSIDRFHTQGKQIYRIMRNYDAIKNSIPWLSGPYATALLTDYPNDIQKAVRVRPTSGLLTHDNIAFVEKKLINADAEFFELFSFPLLKGDPKTALQNPASIVLTETAATKYFGDEDPMGKVLELDKDKQLTVTGIAKDIPYNSHLDFDVIVPLSNYYQEDWFNQWINNSLSTYALLDKNTDVAKLQSQFPAFMDKHLKAELDQMGMHFELSLTPLQDIYFEASDQFDYAKHGDKKVVYIFLCIAILILVIACINFMNLCILKALDRSKEVGLRKVMGAQRKQLAWQFIGESIFLAIFACILAVGLLLLLLPYYNQLLGYNLTIGWNTWQFYAFLLFVVLSAGLLAGSYPAWFISAFAPIQALKGKLRLGKGGASFREGLVIIQFSISIVLVIGTLIIMQQMNFMKQKALGYDDQQSVVIPLDNVDIYRNMQSFKQDLLQQGDIQAVSFMSGEPGGFFDLHTFEAEGQQQGVWKSRTEFSDFQFAKTLGVDIIAGRDFSLQHPTDSTDAAIINRSAATALGFTPDEAIGKWIRNTIRDESRRTIIGVVEDFHFLSLKEHIDPLVIAPSDDLRVAVIKINTANLKGALKTIESAYNRAAPLYPFEYTFLDDKFDSLYKTDIAQQRIISLFSGLAIFVASLGLYGLASFTAKKRHKEIGIRKVLGASVTGSVALLSKDFIRPVFIAVLIALPTAWWAMNSWLQNFAYQITMEWWTLALAGLLAAAIAFLTVSGQAIKTALSNPTKSLRDE